MDGRIVIAYGNNELGARPFAGGVFVSQGLGVSGLGLKGFGA